VVALLRIEEHLVIPLEDVPLSRARTNADVGAWRLLGLNSPITIDGCGVR
jgi:hypothetical protein